MLVQTNSHDLHVWPYSSHQSNRSICQSARHDAAVDVAGTDTVDTAAALNEVHVHADDNDDTRHRQRPCVQNDTSVHEHADGG